MSLSVQLRRGTAAQNSTFTGRPGELIYTTDTKRLFVHDGTTAGGTEIGAVGSLPNDSVTFAKIEEIASNTILGNNTAGSSDILELTAAQTRSLLNVKEDGDVDSLFSTKVSLGNFGSSLAAIATSGAYSDLSGAPAIPSSSDDLTEGTTNLFNKAHTGEVTGSTALTIANGVVDSDNLSSTLDFGSIV